jgi:hypothetical protein
MIKNRFLVGFMVFVSVPVALGATFRISEETEARLKCHPQGGKEYDLKEAAGFVR